MSDHCSIVVTLKTKFLLQSNPSDSYRYIDKPRRVQWNENISLSFERFLQDVNSRKFLSDFDLEAAAVCSQMSLDTAVSSLAGFIVGTAVQAAGPALGVSKPNVPKRQQGRSWKFCKKSKRYKKPKWFDESCHSVQKQIRLTSKLLRNQPGNPYLRKKLLEESKIFKKLRKHKQKQFVDHMFSELDQLHQSNPKGYMDLVKSMRDGSFDKPVSDSTSYVSPEKWREHFKGLLGPQIPSSPTEDVLIDYVRQHCQGAKSELDRPFTRTELLTAISGLANNKSISFDRVSNEMLKVSKLIIANQLLALFNRILVCSIYPTVWKDNILTPLHKSDSLEDPSNFRGLAVGSCLGKLFNKLLQRRLEQKCVKENLIHVCQGSGRKGSRTSDHLLIVRFLIDKYVKNGKDRLFACFFDIRKAFDSVPRNLLFYTLLKDYKIGGNFLKILQEIYSQNQIFIKVSEGLCQPFSTTVGVLQGEVNSPLLFNIFVNKISEVFDQSCDPVTINDSDQNCLLWADDLFVVSQTATGLQNCINKVNNFYKSLGLELNIKKTKIMIFNKSGKVLTGYNFLLADTNIEVTDCYQYLGIKIRPSGSFTLAVEELCAKSRRAWFSISNLIYKDKRMPVSRAFQLFDSLVTPVALYASEFWFPLILSKKSFNGLSDLMSCWESFKCETVNQQCSRILLSVHKKASRLAVLGDLGRYPLAINALTQCLNYRLNLVRKPASSLVGLAMAEMRSMASEGVDCWLGRVNKINNIIKLPKIYYNKVSGHKILKCVRSKFDRYWLDQIKSVRVGPDGVEHNKLLTYSSFKSHFGTEPYITLVRNRSQRCHLTRLRVSAHRLSCEVLRYRRPPVPREQRYCAYCPPVPGTGARPLDTESHCVTQCVVGQEDRVNLYESLSSRNSIFVNLTDNEKFKVLVCPVNPTDCKVLNRFLQKQFADRDKIDSGE